MNDDEFKGELTLSTKGHSVSLYDMPKPVLRALFESVSEQKKFLRREFREQP